MGRILRGSRLWRWPGLLDMLRSHLICVRCCWGSRRFTLVVEPGGDTSRISMPQILLDGKSWGTCLRIVISRLLFFISFAIHVMVFTLPLQVLPCGMSLIPIIPKFFRRGDPTFVVLFRCMDL